MRSATHWLSRLREALRTMRPLMVVPWLASFAVHASIVALAFFVVWTVTTPKPPPPPPAVVSFFDPAPVRTTPDDPEVERADETENDEQPLLEPEPTLAPLPSPESILDQVIPEIAPETRATESPSTVMAELMYQRRFPDIEFFGAGSGDAESIVYVVDASGSMVSTFPLLRRELEHSIQKLAPTQRFQVVFFQGNAETGEAVAVASPHPAEPDRTRETRLIRATRSNVRGVTEWIGTIRPQGRSNPIPALEIALALKPEVIFLLSNTITGVGEWEADAPSILKRLDALNPADRRNGNRPVAIKTIEFLQEDPSGLLQAIGRLHGGPDGYTFISRTDLTSR